MGAAALAHVSLTGTRPDRQKLTHVFLGPEAKTDEIASLLADTDAEVQDFRGREPEFLEATVDRLEQGQVVGWFHGGSRIGPRALGGRSILADPRRPEMRDLINSRVKQRKSFRPFAPAVLEDRAAEHFDLDHASPFMLETCRVTSPLALPRSLMLTNRRASRPLIGRAIAGLRSYSGGFVNEPAARYS